MQSTIKEIMAFMAIFAQRNALKTLLLILLQMCVQDTAIKAATVALLRKTTNPAHRAVKIISIFRIVSESAWLINPNAREIANWRTVSKTFR